LIADWKVRQVLTIYWARSRARWGLHLHLPTFKSLKAKLREDGALDIKNEGLKEDLRAELGKSKKAAKNTADAGSGEKPTKPTRPIKLKAKAKSKEHDTTVAKPRTSRARTKVSTYADDVSDEWSAAVRPYRQWPRHRHEVAVAEGW
jgi:hypothetical protein